MTFAIKSSSVNVDNWFQAIVESHQTAANAVVKDAIEEGENLMHHFIETRGTEKSGKRGRIDTGLMDDSVSSQMVANTENVQSGQFGWIDTREDYFLYQDEGFEHYGSGEIIPGMMALTDAFEEVTTNLLEDYKKEVK